MSEKFPDFMKIWHAYPRTVLKGLSLLHAACTMLWWQGDSHLRAADKLRNDAGDAFRAFVMKDMGGLYLDLDIECFQHREHMIHGLDLVLQVNLDDTLKTGQVPSRCLSVRSYALHALTCRPVQQVSYALQIV